ncbi:MAG: hypothetical protein KC492_36615 [Myxococcales bacterium]|nr:hypothetical protein [Myxococcales bacterium]
MPVMSVILPPTMSLIGAFVYRRYFVCILLLTPRVLDLSRCVHHVA